MPPEGFDEMKYHFRPMDRTFDEWIKYPYNTTRPMRLGDGWIDVPDHIRLLPFEYSVE